MRRLVLLLAALIILAVPVMAGSPHFVTVSGVNNGDGTFTVTGKEAGLGGEAQVHIEITATAMCMNGGSNHPKAANKDGVGGGGDFPVQNGKANFSITTDPPTFQPPCDPPMTVMFSGVVVTDTTNGISINLTGLF